MKKMFSVPAVEARALHRMMRLGGSLIWAGCIAAAGLLAVQAVYADDSPPPRTIRPVGVQIIVAHVFRGSVQASHRPDIDPRCGDIHRRLRGHMANINRIRLLNQHRYQLAFGEQARVVLPSGREVRIRPISVVRRQLHIQLEMPGVMSTRLQLSDGRPILFGNHMYEDGMLVVQLLPEFSGLVADNAIEEPLRGPELERVTAPGLAPR